MEELCLLIQKERWKMSRLQNAESLAITDESLSEYLTSRYPNRSFDDFSRRLTVLVGELRSGGFATIAAVDKALERTKKAAEFFEAENPRSRLVGSRYSAIHVMIISISLLHNRFFISWPSILDDCSPEKVKEYRRHILPERDTPQPTED
jgi:hypothetical protein